jgi:hypothetical protein
MTFLDAAVRDVSFGGRSRIARIGMLRDQLKLASLFVAKLIALDHEVTRDAASVAKHSCAAAFRGVINISANFDGAAGRLFEAPFAK